MSEVITSDNPSFSDPKLATMEGQIDALGSAIRQDLAESIADYVRASLSANTRKAYLSDLGQFAAWGGSIPSSPETVAAYLTAKAPVLNPGTLARHLVAIGKAHQASGLASPTSSALVKAVLRGIRRSNGKPQEGAKPLLRDDLFLVLDRLTKRPKDLRDRAILLLGFAGGFRRSELVGLDFEDLERVRQGLIITIKRSKTDQDGKGRRVGIPFGRTRHCPVLAVEAWLLHSGIFSGPIFLPVTKSGLVQSTRLSTDGLCRMLQARIGEAGINATGYSGHSLRSGFATSAAQAGVSSWKIRQQTGHASDAMLSRYIKAGEIFLDNAASLLL
jgi:integrase